MRKQETMNPLLKESDKWLDMEAPHQHVVISSRIRLARNISRIPFATHAKEEELAEIHRLVENTIQSRVPLKNFQPITLHDVSVMERRYLKESHIISPEMEKGSPFRLVYVSPDFRVSIMVNEEDHIRIQGLAPGLQLMEIFHCIVEIDNELLDNLHPAFSDQYGFLTACPTNLGTGLRVSVMMQLPALVLTRKIDEVLENIQPLGIAVRGFYGENSEFVGDIYQVSNEISLGKSEEEILNMLLNIILNIIDKEEKAREDLFLDRILSTEDIIWRSYGILSQARLMDSQEAMKLLSRIRLGIDRGYFRSLNHYQLNKLIIDIQPAHLQSNEDGEEGTEARDMARADLLRHIFNAPGAKN
jgi:protein arginine kinase